MPVDFSLGWKEKKEPIIKPPYSLDDYLVLQDVKFEAKATYEGSNKKLLTYDASLASLRSRGQTRHPRPQEVFGLLIANLENKVTAEQKSIAEDMLNSYGEWLSAAMERNKDKLTIYTDPEGLVWNGSTYVMENFTFESKRDFSIAGIPSTKLVDLNQFGNDLVEFLYTRKFAQLPQAMCEDGKRAQLYLPADGQILPAGRGSFGSRFYVGSYNYNNRASRGVVPSSRAKK
ncbi:MAG: hypothetical protein AABX64_01845 [Nanoarchaeota archaeon]